MAWKGTLRSISAAARRMEKDAERRHKQAQKIQMTTDAAGDVESWENYINDLLTVHTDLTSHIDWEGLLLKAEPKEPVVGLLHQGKAQEMLSSFKPSIFDFFQGGSAGKRKLLEEQLKEAKRLDASAQKTASEKHANELADWQSDKILAKRLLAGESAAIQSVITEMQALSKTDLIGSSVQFSIDDNYIHARPQVHTDEIVPNFRRKQLASGKLSETKMPTAQFNELYQDYVSSVALKVAGDMFQMLPIQEVFVTCESDMLNSATGHKKATPILSVQFIRATFGQLRLLDIAPSDSMANFNHVVKFSRTKGFSAIVPLGER